MAIQILSPRLANQIAAGEVVERPASVIKELVENSLDAGATQIRIDVEQGGAKLIRVEDNGCGIAHPELALALARHATSKISNLADLEAILSLGFRGEALASISSVSRLTLTSRPAEQAEAWQAIAQGRDMEVKLQPAALGIGTRIEVQDLFFNTPARRKFLRSEKTEFSHIDELVRRVALSRFDVEWILTHNGRMVRRYRAVQDARQQAQRLRDVAGPRFSNQALFLDCQHLDLHLSGWLASASAVQERMDIQYCYVNGRMIRDKVMSHAIRQAYEEVGAVDATPAYVLYLQLPANVLDVNVHPTKHEVRFHQARLVHDFVCTTLRDALLEELHSSTETPLIEPLSNTVDDKSPAQPSNVAPSNIDRQSAVASLANGQHSASSDADSISARPRSRTELQSRSAGRHNYKEREPSARIEAGWKGYQQLLQGAQQMTMPAESRSASESREASHEALSIRALCLYQHHYLLLEGESLFLVSLKQLNRAVAARQLNDILQSGLTGQPLLIPTRIEMERHLLSWLEQQQELIARFGLELRVVKSHQLMVCKVPALLRHTNIAEVIPTLLQRLYALNGDLNDDASIDLCHWMVVQSEGELPVLSLAQAEQLMLDYNALQPQWQHDRQLCKPVDLECVLEEFSCDG